MFGRTSSNLTADSRSIVVSAVCSRQQWLHERTCAEPPSTERERHRLHEQSCSMVKEILLDATSKRIATES